MDNKHLSLQELSLLRQKALEAVVFHGPSRSKVCEIFGFCFTSLLPRYESSRTCQPRYEDECESF